MAYHKRLVQARTCAHCGSAFSAAHKSRLYCSSSCNTLAWRARKGGTVPAGRPGPRLGERPSPAAAAAAAPPLAFNWQNVGVIAAGAAAGQLAVQVGTHLMQELRRPASAPLPAPVAWLPAEIVHARGPLQWAQDPGWPQPLALLAVAFRGRMWHYAPAEQRLFGQYPDGTWRLITSRGQLDALAPSEALAALLGRYGLSAPPLLDETNQEPPAPEG